MNKYVSLVYAAPICAGQGPWARAMGPGRGPWTRAGPGPNAPGPWARAQAPGPGVLSSLICSLLLSSSVGRRPGSLQFVVGGRRAVGCRLRRLLPRRRLAARLAQRRALRVAARPREHRRF